MNVRQIIAAGMPPFASTGALLISICLAASPEAAERNVTNLLEGVIYHASSILQVPTFNTTLKGRVLLDLFSEPDIFNIKWDQLQAYNGIIYPALPDLYGPTMNVSPLHLTCPALCDLIMPKCCPGVEGNGAQGSKRIEFKTRVLTTLSALMQQAHSRAYNQFAL